MKSHTSPGSQPNKNLSGLNSAETVALIVENARSKQNRLSLAQAVKRLFDRPTVPGLQAIVLIHNHPSGNPAPSEPDIKLTRDLIRAGQLLKIQMLDHLIMRSTTRQRTQGYSSLRELGCFYE